MSGSADHVADEVTALVAGGRRAPGPRPGRGRDRRWSATGACRPTGTTPPVPTDVHVYDAVAPALGDAFGRAAAGQPRPLRLRRPRRDHDLPRLVDRAPPASRPADRASAAPRSRPTWPRCAWAGAATARLRRRRPARHRRRALAQRLGWAERGSTCPPAATTRSCRRPRWRT